MEAASSFFIGLLAGWFFRESIIKIRITPREKIAGGGYQPKTRGIIQLNRPAPPAGGSGVLKPNKITDADRVAGYIKMAALADNAPARDRISSRQRLLNKAEAIMDAAGERLQ